MLVLHGRQDWFVPFANDELAAHVPGTQAWLPITMNISLSPTVQRAFTSGCWTGYPKPAGSRESVALCARALCAQPTGSHFSFVAPIRAIRARARRCRFDRARNSSSSQRATSIHLQRGR